MIPERCERIGWHNRKTVIHLLPYHFKVFDGETLLYETDWSEHVKKLEMEIQQLKEIADKRYRFLDGLYTNLKTEKENIEQVSKTNAEIIERLKSKIGSIDKEQHRDPRTNDYCVECDLKQILQSILTGYET